MDVAVKQTTELFVGNVQADRRVSELARKARPELQDVLSAGPTGGDRWDCSATVWSDSVV